MIHTTFMPRCPTADYLDRYPKLPIADYRERIRDAGKTGTPTALTLEYKLKDRLYHYSIQLTTMPCHYGGLRYWWLCPKCGKRCRRAI